MQSEKWFANRRTAEQLLIALGKTTPDVMQTLQDHELKRVGDLLMLAMAACVNETTRRDGT